jgi:hypothetical protein
MKWVKVIRIVVLMGAMVVLALPAVGQRYLPGMRGVEFGGGVAGWNKGYYLHLGYSKYLYSKNRWGFSGEYLQRNYHTEVGNIPVAQFTINPSYCYRLIWDYTQSAVLAVGVTGVFGYETVNWSRYALPNGAQLVSSDAFIYGAEVLLEFEYYIDDRYALLATIKERCAGGSSVGVFQTTFGVGIKYILE